MPGTTPWPGAICLGSRAVAQHWEKGTSGGLRTLLTFTACRMPRAFLGMHDLRSFTEDDPEEKSTTLKLDRLQVIEHGDLILVRIVGSHFIWKVVRQIVGVLVEAGRGKLSKNDIDGFLHTATDQPAHYTAPPSGLFLERVYYRGRMRSTNFLRR